MTNSSNNFDIFRRAVAHLFSGAGTLGLVAIVGAGLPSQSEARPEALAAAAPTLAASARELPAPAADDAAEGLAWFHGTDGDDRLTASAADDVIDAYAGNDVLRGLAGDDHLDGFAGDDTVIGGSGDDVLDGSAGNDTLVGGSGDDALDGGIGDDVLEGGAGDDRYVFGQGFGRDVIDERNQRGGDDVIVFESLRRADAQVLRSAEDLIIRDTSSSDEVTIKGFFAAESRQVERVQYADGEVDLRAALDRGQAFLLATN